MKHYNKKEILKDFGLHEDKKTILFFAGGEFGLGKSRTYSLLQTLVDNFDNLQIVAISGRNEKMKKSFEYIVRHSHKEEKVKILDYTTKVPELMSISDIVITKPGGLTTTESLASRFTYYCYKSYSRAGRRKCFIFRKQKCCYLDKKK